MEVVHEINPIYNQESKILILGTFPSVKSRVGNFFYHHPQNRFWKVLSNIYQEEISDNIDDKKLFLIKHHIAVWDVIKSCKIVGSSDSSIEEVVVNDLSLVINHSKVTKVYTNGNLAYQLYQKYCYPKTNIPAIKLPSTSPANASFSLDKLIHQWKVINRN